MTEDPLLELRGVCAAYGPYEALFDVSFAVPTGRAVALVKASFVTLLADVPGLRLSARNLIGGTVVKVLESVIESEVVLDIGDGCELAAIVTTHSLRELGLAPGVTTLACFKASHVILAVEG